MKATVFWLVLVPLLACITGMVISVLPSTISPSYYSAVKVKHSSEVECAVSNLLFNLQKKGFVPVSLSIIKSASGVYTISYGGVDREKLVQEK